MRNLLNIDQSPRPSVQLEIETLQALIDNHPDTVVSSTKTVKPALTVSAPVSKVKEIIANSEQDLPIEKPLPKENKDLTVQPIDVPSNRSEKILMASSQWQNVLEELRQTHNTLYSVLRMAKLQEDKLSQHIIELEFSFPFHQKRMSDQKNQLPVHEVMDKLGLESCEIVCSLVAKDSKKQPVLVSASQTTTDDSVIKNDNIMLDQVKNIFGNAEVLE